MKTTTMSMYACLLALALAVSGCKREAPAAGQQEPTKQAKPAEPSEPAKPAAASVDEKALAAAKAKHPGCACAGGKTKTMWCDKCDMGFIEGKPDKDKAKVLAAVARLGKDDHAGHDHAACGCGDGKKGGTLWCAKCNKGFIAGKVEMDKSKVLAAVAKLGKDEGHGSASCRCAEGKKGGTLWCGACNMGFIAGKVEMDKTKVAAAAKASK